MVAVCLSARSSTSASLGPTTLFLALGNAVSEDHLYEGDEAADDPGPSDIHGQPAAEEDNAANMVGDPLWPPAACRP